MPCAKEAKMITFANPQHKPTLVKYVHMLETLFLKSIKHFSQLESTNTEAEHWISKSRPAEGSAVLADFQSCGQGLGQNTWESEQGLNLLVSFVLYPAILPADQQFTLNKVASLAVRACAQHFLPSGYEALIKWPNDIYAGYKKIAGILSRNTIAGQNIESTIIGVGLNVNQSRFSRALPNPVSLKMLSGNTFSIDEVLRQLAFYLQKFYTMLNDDNIEEIDKQYLSALLNYQREASYSASGLRFTGTILGVSKYGRLIMEIENEIKDFDLKEIRFIF